MDNDDAKQHLDYEQFLDSRLRGLSIQDLRKLSDKIIDRVRGLDEPGIQLSPEAEGKVREVDGMFNELTSALPMPTSEEIKYFLNYAQRLEYDLVELKKESDIIWSWLKEHNKLGHLNESQVNRMKELVNGMYDEIEELDEWTEKLPPDCEETEWEFPFKQKFSLDDKPVIRYRDHMGL